MTPKISIIIPMKNEESFIEECLRSSLRQMSSSFNLQIIVVDDHSTDSSCDIVKELSGQYDSIELLENKGSGIVDALNTGCDHADGEFISRMDADDIMPEDKLESFYQTLVSTPSIDVITGQVKYISTGKELNEGYLKYADWLNEINFENPFDQIYKECPIASPNWMMRRQKFDEVGGVKGLEYPEDYDLVFRWYKNKLNTGCVEQVTHVWRDHNARASRNDPNYADNRFVELKVSRFLEIDRMKELPLCVLGGGKKGKLIASQLIQSKSAFRWFTNNPKKIGVNIYGVILEDWNILKEVGVSQIIIAISGPGDHAEVQKHLAACNDSTAYAFF